jgi:hypothetical protein
MEETARRDLEGQELINVRGERLGKIDALFTYGDVQSPNWARVKIGRLGLHKAMAPLENAEEVDGKLCLPYETEHVQHAPEMEPEDGQLSEDQVDLLCRHYGLERVAPPSGIADDDIELPRETRDAKPPALEEGPDNEITQRRRERAEELGVPVGDDKPEPQIATPETGTGGPSREDSDEADSSAEG